MMNQFNDMSHYLQSGPLLKSAYLLSNNCIGTYVNTAKPSIRALFAYGHLGRLHNVLYDLDCVNLYSDRYGIYPFCTINGETLFPYRTGHDVRSDASYLTGAEENVHCYPEENRIVFENLPLYKERSMEVNAVLPRFEIVLQNSTIRIYVEFPANAEQAKLHLPWYPLFDTYTVGGECKSIQYYKHGFHGYFPNGYSDFPNKEILLKDTLSRQADLHIKASKGTLELYSSTVKDKGYAMMLSTDAIADHGELNVSITVLPADITVNGNHYYACGTDAEVQVSTKGGVSIHSFRVPDAPGVHSLSLDDGKAFLYCAVPDKRKTMKRAADGCLQLFWKDGKLEGTPPYAFDPTCMKPMLRAGMRYCSHGMRLISCLAAEGIWSNNISYVDAAFQAICKVASVSYHGTAGNIFTPLLMDDTGDPGSYNGSSRPSDAGILIRGLIHTAKGYLHFGKYEKAKECIQLARAYAKTIEIMQNDDGSFFERYQYPSLKPANKNKGTVNNWCLQLWKLLPLLKYFNMSQDATDIKNLICKYIKYQIEKDNSILFVSGGGEDARDFGDAMNTDATLFAIQYLLTGEEIWKTYAEQALKKSWLLSCMWADMPQFFGLYGNSDIGEFYDQPYGIFSAGGMHDLTAVEANLFAAEVLNSSFGQDMADRLHAGRLGSFIRENGGMYMVILQCPNFMHYDERHSETLMYGGVGVYSWTEAEKSSQPLREILNQYTS